MKATNAVDKVQRGQNIMASLDLLKYLAETISKLEPAVINQVIRGYATDLESTLNAITGE